MYPKEKISLYKVNAQKDGSSLTKRLRTTQPEDPNYAKGGNVEENNEMFNSQIKEAKHHIDELSKVVNKKTDIEPWVLSKMTRAKTDLSDLTHYLDGLK
jgi:hypothetical protein